MPESFKDMLCKYDRVLIEVDSLENDFTRCCKIGDILIAEPGSPKILATNRYIIGIGKRLIYSKVMQQKKNRNCIVILGIGEAPIDDIVIWCRAKKYRHNK